MLAEEQRSVIAPELLVGHVQVRREGLDVDDVLGPDVVARRALTGVLVDEEEAQADVALKLEDARAEDVVRVYHQMPYRSARALGRRRRLSRRFLGAAGVRLCAASFEVIFSAL